MALIYNQAWNIKNYRYVGDVSRSMFILTNYTYIFPSLNWHLLPFPVFYFLHGVNIVCNNVILFLLLFFILCGGNGSLDATHETVTIDHFRQDDDPFILCAQTQVLHKPMIPVCTQT